MSKSDVAPFHSENFICWWFSLCRYIELVRAAKNWLSIFHYVLSYRPLAWFSRTASVFNVNVHLSRYTPTGLKANMSISTPFTSKCWSSSSNSLFRIFKVKIFRDGNKANIEIFVSFLWRAWVDWQQEPLRPHLLPSPIHRPALLRQVSEKTANNQTNNNKQTSKQTNNKQTFEQKETTGKASNNLLSV